jgi:hypothetical protein
MAFRLPPIRDLNLSGQDDKNDFANAPRDERLAKVRATCVLLPLS